MKVVIFNVKYSPNLGDGVIAECLESELARRTGWQVQSIDLAGREAWREPGGDVTRTLALDVLRRMPQLMRDASVELVLNYKLLRSLRPKWREMLEDADFAVIGGGQLIQDGDLNFPLKLTAAAAECALAGVPTAVYAVGATASRSAYGGRLWRRFLTSDNLFHVSARDAASCDVLSGLGRDAELAPDPGLLAASAWPAPARQAQRPPRIGVGITHPAVLSYHSSGGERMTLEAAIARYGASIQALMEDGREVILFTNGAEEDRRALDAVKSWLAGEGLMQGSSVRIPEPAMTPAQLCHLIADLDCVIAHRLHANIVAYGYGVVPIGVEWDHKVKAFFSSIGRREYVLAFDDALPRRIRDVVAKTLADGVDQDLRGQTLAAAERGVEALISQIVTACGESSRSANYNEAAVQSAKETVPRRDLLAESSGPP